VAIKHYVFNRRVKRRLRWQFWVLAVLAFALLYFYWWTVGSKVPSPAPILPDAGALLQPRPGDLLGVNSTQSYTAAQTDALAKENYGSAMPPVATGITKYVFHYRSELPNGEDITVYGRAYLPAVPRAKLPIFAFAPGTTGIGDECAASLEKPKVANWANYDSHLAAYASQGYAVVTTDYEGMRDSSRIHHYMVGELEGRALLDSVRALKHLPAAGGRLDTGAVFFAGYSQGGQAAFWADKIAAGYAPEIKDKGVVGFGPVMDVKETLADVTRGANINWFGPYLLYSYSDYYHTRYPDNQILVPQFLDTLNKDVPAHCIDTDIVHWGRKPEGVYTPQFLQTLSSGQWAGTPFESFGADMDKNAVGALSTSSAKRINGGTQDNVVLPAQQQAAFNTLCHSSTGPVQLAEYQDATHYNTMVRSFSDTLAWMHALIAGLPQASNCPQ